MFRTLLQSALALLVGIPLIAMTYGGWATVSVQNLPDYIVAGEPTNMTFAVRQHGEDLIPDLKPTIVATSGSREFTARAVETNKPGYYTVTLRAPAAGDWSMTIHSGFGRSHVKLLPIAAINSGARVVSFSETERGARLFAARSCVTCHAHAAVAGSGYVKAAPALTDVRLPQDYLRRFLADPSIRATAEGRNRMPDPNLEPAEIEALVAFLTASQAQRQATR